MRLDAQDNWLAKIDEERDEQDTTIVVFNLNGLTESMAQDALDLMYGTGTYSAHNHGTVLVIYAIGDQVTSWKNKMREWTDGRLQLWAFERREKSTPSAIAARQMLEERNRV